MTKFCVLLITIGVGTGGSGGSMNRDPSSWGPRVMEKNLGKTFRKIIKIFATRQWWIEGWAIGAAAQGTKGRGHQRVESKNNANLHDEKRDWFYHFK